MVLEVQSWPCVLKHLLPPVTEAQLSLSDVSSSTDLSWSLEITSDLTQGQELLIGSARRAPHSDKRGNTKTVGQQKGREARPFPVTGVHSWGQRGRMCGEGIRTIRPPRPVPNAFFPRVARRDGCPSSRAEAGAMRSQGSLSHGPYGVKSQDAKLCAPRVIIKNSSSITPNIWLFLFEVPVFSPRRPL